jgi:putative transposase
VLAQALMGADVTARIGAARGERNPEGRTTQRNGYRERRWDTRAGTVELAIPRLRQGSYFPDWLLEPRRRAGKALASVVMQAYVEGVSTRRVDDVARAMGVEGISKSQVSRICGELDEVVASWRSRPLDAGPYPSSGSTRWCSRSARAAAS